MKTKIAEARLRQSVEIRRRDLSAEGAPLAVTRIINQNDDNHVGRALRRIHKRDLVWRGGLIRIADDAFEFGLRLRENVISALRFVGLGVLFAGNQGAGERRDNEENSHA
ncbi:hypothetical protein RBB77_03270 [Tunturibacter psychrotolerans]|uniref:Uncharacterized protein n=1 Tax=Tunturiibacter psychrotolerans TaxID=3069686 RepID=A0AAU7ZSD3_9BACT